jgi:hypothetical protein
MWTDKELEELEDTALMKRARKWREELHMLATNIAPKLQAAGAFSAELQVDDIVGYNFISFSLNHLY